MRYFVVNNSKTVKEITERQWYQMSTLEEEHKLFAMVQDDPKGDTEITKNQVMFFNRYDNGHLTLGHIQQLVTLTNEPCKLCLADEGAKEDEDELTSSMGTSQTDIL